MEVPNDHLVELQRQAEVLASFPDRFGLLADPLRKLAGSGYFTAWLNRQLAALCSHPMDAGLWFWPHFDVERFSGMSLSVRIFSEKRPLRSNPQAAIYAPIGEGTLHADVYALPPHQNDMFDPNLELQPLASMQVSPGEVLVTDTAHVYDFRCEAPIATAELAATSNAPLIWSFDRVTLKAQQATYSSIVDLQLRAATEVLGHLNDPGSIAVLEAFTTHAHHAVRWAAIQNIGRIAPDVVRSFLERAITDDHPHVRAAASKALDKLRANR